MKRFCAIILLFTFCVSEAQQLPYFTQFTSHSFALNPACTGTKRLLDVRTSFRAQWVGFEGAPLTQCIGVNSKLVKGRLGVGGIVEMDETGPTKRASYTGAAAFHIKFPDMKLSMGIGFSLIKYTIDGSKISIRSTRDAAVDQAVSDFDWAKNASAGVFLHNDRFHFGISVLNMIETTEKFYLDNTEKEAQVGLKPHFYINLGYNYHVVPKFVWRNAAQLKYGSGVPMVVDYKVNMYYDEKFFVGGSIRLKDAIALEAGLVIQEDFQVCYSYDIIVSPLRKYNSGSHEIMLVWSTDFSHNKGKNRFKEFQRQKYGYMF